MCIADFTLASVDEQIEQFLNRRPLEAKPLPKPDAATDLPPLPTPGRAAAGTFSTEQMHMSLFSRNQKFGPQKNGMPHDRWLQAQSTRLRWRWFFQAGVRGPNNPHARDTYNVGRNAAKRARRAAEKEFNAKFSAHGRRS